MPNIPRALLTAAVTLLAAPGLAALLYLAGRPEPAGVLTGLAAGLLLRDRPARAAMATLCGSVVAVAVGSLVVQGFRADGPDFPDAMAGWPGWVAGAVLAYALAARRPTTSARAITAHRPTTRADATVAREAATWSGASAAVPRWRGAATRTLVTAAVLAAVLCCGQLVLAQAAGMTLWEDYHEWDGPGLYRDLTRATWHPAAAVIVATLTATQVFGERVRHWAVPVAAWLGCALIGGPVQYAQALGAGERAALLALLAALAGGAIGAAAATAALGRPGIWLGLTAFVLLFTAQEVRGGWVEDLPDLWGLYVSVALVAGVAAWTAWRETSFGAGAVAGLAGPMLIWSVYLLIGSRHYDHASQSGPYTYALLIALAAMAVAPVAAGLARAFRGDPATPPGSGAPSSPAAA
ncbi:hypothetical protein GCM10009850_104570 [Nonomuraea monospora]|uniref:Integral membrane protein n=1 Tax=Nonomuraea monospora TaxID=568818 RepID=A0ABP5PTG6_9ACTN